MRWIHRSRGVLVALAALLLLVLVTSLLGPLRAAVGDLGLLGHALVAGAAAVLLVLARLGRRWLPRRVLLEIDLEAGVREAPPPAGVLGAQRDGAVTLRDVVDALERARGDRRVVGALVRLGNVHPGLATAQEIRDAIGAFAAQGKRVVAFAETFGEGSSATLDYFLAAACDEILLQPTGLLEASGLRLDTPFVRTTLDKLGIDPQLRHRRDYKTAKNLFTERGLTQAHRESLASLLDDMARQVVAGIAEGRERSTEEVRALLDEGPFTAPDALERGLVDGLAYRDEVRESTEKELRAKRVGLTSYLRRAGRPHARGTAIALVHGVGSIARGRGRRPYAPGGSGMRADDVTEAFRRAVKARSTKAIVFRVASPGGSAVASDAIWREVERARKAGKPVVVSMGDVAGSGGYYVACGADRIVAQPGTLTGSIGVVWGKFVTREAWRRLGVEWEGMGVGRHAAMWSPLEGYDAEGEAKLARLLDRVYEDFKAKVATGRNLSATQVEAAAQGRVWTGAQARDHGLVDALGGLEQAVQLAREAAGLAPEARVRLRTFEPRRAPFWRRRADESARLAGRVDEALSALGPLLAAARDGRRIAASGPLTMPLFAPAPGSHPEPDDR